jgi:hypothetical protein
MRADIENGGAFVDAPDEATREDLDKQARKLARVAVENVCDAAVNVIEASTPPGRWRDFAIGSIADARRWGLMAANEVVAGVAT